MQTNKIDYQTRDCTIAVIFQSERNTTTTFYCSLNSFYLIPRTVRERICREECRPNIDLGSAAQWIVFSDFYITFCLDDITTRQSRKWQTYDVATMIVFNSLILFSASFLPSFEPPWTSTALHRVINYL